MRLPAEVYYIIAQQLIDDLHIPRHRRQVLFHPLVIHLAHHLTGTLVNSLIPAPSQQGVRQFH